MALNLMEPLLHVAGSERKEILSSIHNTGLSSLYYDGMRKTTV